MTVSPQYRPSDAAGRMTAAAGALLDALYQDQRARAAMEFGDEPGERENWHYVPRVRPGLSLKEMDEPQRTLCLALVAAGLSERGEEKARLIIEVEELLGRIEGPDRKFKRDNELYYISIFGTPGEAAWGWRFEGHASSYAAELGGEAAESRPERGAGAGRRRFGGGGGG